MTAMARTQTASSIDRSPRHWIAGVGHTFSASPWAYGGKVFCLSEEGDTFVINPGDAYDEVAKNSLGEMTLATPAVTRDGLFVRTATALYRIR